MKIYLKEEYIGSERIPRVRKKEELRLLITTKVFPTKEALDTKLKCAIAIDDFDCKIVFQDHKETMAQITMHNMIYEYYCLHIEGTLLFYNEGLNCLKCKEVHL